MSKGYQYDFFAEEWSYVCRTCDTEMFAPTNNDLRYNHWKHTHETCLGGW